MNIFETNPKFLISVGIVSLLTGCVTTPTHVDYQSKTDELLSNVAPWSVPETITQTQTVQVSLADLIDSAELNTLIDQALANSPTIEAQALALQKVQLAADVTRANNRPSVSAGASAKKAQESSNSLSASVDVSWEIDLWQRLADRNSISDLAIGSQALTLQSVKDSYVAQVINEWLTIKLSQQGLEYATAINKNLIKNLAVVDQEYAQGSSELSDLNSARLDLADSNLDVEIARTNLVQAINQMRALIGDQTYLPERSSQLPTASLVLLNLPKQDLARRPDLQSAFLDITSAQLSSDVAYKAMLPSLDIGAALTSSGTTPSDLLSGSPLWSLLAQVSAPLYQSGALRAQAESADLDVQIAFANYRDTLWTAVTEVEDALELERSLTARIEQTQRIISLSKQTFNQVADRYQTGDAYLEDLLSSQRTLLTLDSQLNSLIQQRLSNRISLGLALGLGAQ